MTSKDLQKMMVRDLNDKEKLKYWVKTMNILTRNFNFLKGRCRFYNNVFFEDLQLDEFAILYSMILDNRAKIDIRKIIDEIELEERLKNPWIDKYETWLII